MDINEDLPVTPEPVRTWTYGNAIITGLPKILDGEDLLTLTLIMANAELKTTKTTVNFSDVRPQSAKTAARSKLILLDLPEKFLVDSPNAVAAVPTIVPKTRSKRFVKPLRASISREGSEITMKLLPNVTIFEEPTNNHLG